jgi:hypothetical protein
LLFETFSFGNLLCRLRRHSLFLTPVRLVPNVLFIMGYIATFKILLEVFPAVKIISHLGSLFVIIHALPALLVDAAS